MVFEGAEQFCHLNTDRALCYFRLGESYGAGIQAKAFKALGLHSSSLESLKLLCVVRAMCKSLEKHGDCVSFGC